MQSIIKFLPNLLTLSNLFCGSIAVMFAYRLDYINAAVFVVAGAVFDFFDGFLARLLKSDAELGKQLDSLADVVTFGFAPAVVFYTILNQAIHLSSYHFLKFTICTHYIFAFMSFLILLASAFRLAKFNIDNKQSKGFLGLPTPANALFIISLPFWYDNQFMYEQILNHPWVLIVLCVILAALLVSNLPLFSLKFKNYSLSNNLFQYILLIASLALLILFKFRAFTFIIPLYIALSIIRNLINKINKHEV